MITIIAGSRQGPTVTDVAAAVSHCGWAPSVAHWHAQQARRP